MRIIDVQDAIVVVIGVDVVGRAIVIGVTRVALRFEEIPYPLPFFTMSVV
jgi:hypothetical protein